MLEKDRILKTERTIYGTAKIGDPYYGISNTNREMSISERITLLNQVIDLGVRRFDTSPRYLNAEKILGEVLQYHSGITFLIDTKVDGLYLDKNNDDKEIRKQVENSLKLFNGQKINTLYLHQNEIEIISNKNIQKSLNELKNRGEVSKIGTSVYSLEELSYSLSCGVYDVIQIPFNILNHSFYELAMKSNKNNIELNCRSIFLQGYLLNPKKIHNAPKVLGNKLKKLNELCEKFNTNIENEAKRAIYEYQDLNYIISSLSFNNFVRNLNYQQISCHKDFEKKLKPLQDTNYTFTNPRNW